MARIPSYVLDLDGNEVGVRSKTWRLTDYIVAWYLAKNPMSTKKRLGTSLVMHKSSRKRKFEDDMPMVRRSKIGSDAAGYAEAIEVKRLNDEVSSVEMASAAKCTIKEEF